MYITKILVKDVREDSHMLLRLSESGIHSALRHGSEQNFMYHSGWVDSHSVPWQVSEMRVLVVEDEEKVSRFIVKGLTAERFAIDARATAKRDGSLPKLTNTIWSFLT